MPFSCALSRKESQKKSWQGNDEGGGTSAEYSKRDPEQKEIMA